MSLTGPQKRMLRGLAHHLDPVVLVGQDRVTPGIIREVARALHHHELVKIKLIDSDKEEVTEALDQLLEAVSAEHVQTIGHMVVLWRRNEDEPKVQKLPGEKLKPRGQRKR
ncbi:MAG: ribosome assembly RNA-binding protein YhbY [Alphaproteobacteria bacterium]|nr:ribosome assembly RNA-binding protein YhbY [Alphaproteobacteria bacterium]